MGPKAERREMELRAAEVRAEAARRDLNARWAVGVIIAAIIIVVVAWAAWPHSQPTPPDCQGDADSPCLTTGGSVRWIDGQGAYQFDSLADWREGRAEMLQEQTPGPYVPPGAP
jgi:hypothetical protein